MNENTATTPRTPTLDEIKNVGYTVDIRHLRRHRYAYMTENGKLVIEEILCERKDICASELLARGGKTEVRIYDETGREWFASATCRNDENYCKATGIDECLKRITGLMLVLDGTDGFKCRLQL
jgi:DNA-binding MarR family transcriptional regulator